MTNTDLTIGILIPVLTWGNVGLIYFLAPEKEDKPGTPKKVIDPSEEVTGRIVQFTAFGPFVWIGLFFCYVVPSIVSGIILAKNYILASYNSLVE